MLDLRYVVENLDTVKAALRRRTGGAADALAPIEALSAKRKAAIQQSEGLAAKRNAANKDMAKLPKGGPEFMARREELKALSAEQKQLEKGVNEVEAEIRELLATIPNLPHPSIPDGEDESANRVEKVWGEKPTFDFAPKAHWDVGEGLGIVDFERAAKLSGARFSVLTGMGARLERALHNFMLDVQTQENGYTEVNPPLLVKDSAMFGTSQLPKFADDAFRTHNPHPERGYELYLIPTAEVPLTNLRADEIMLADELPLKYTAYTPCFRSEAGSHGRDVRGMFRQHQFTKVELVKVCTPDEAEAELEALTRDAEVILEKLGLHYRRVTLCTGDLSFGSQKTYDLEVYLPSEDTFREISSCSWFGDYQARRANLRFRAKAKAKPKFCHTLNGSGLALGRCMVALLEQFQRADGSVALPEVLHSYVGATELLTLKRREPLKALIRHWGLLRRRRAREVRSNAAGLGRSAQTPLGL